MSTGKGDPREDRRLGKAMRVGAKVWMLFQTSPSLSIHAAFPSSAQSQGHVSFKYSSVLHVETLFSSASPTPSAPNTPGPHEADDGHFWIDHWLMQLIISFLCWLGGGGGGLCHEGHCVLQRTATSEGVPAERVRCSFRARLRMRLE